MFNMKDNKLARRRTFSQVSETNMKRTFSLLEEKADKIKLDFIAKKKEESKQTKIVDFIKNKLGSKNDTLSKLDT
jgi:hypothetical protein